MGPREKWASTRAAWSNLNARMPHASPGEEGPRRQAFTRARTIIWERGLDRGLAPHLSFTFLGLGWRRRQAGDISFTEEWFTGYVLKMHGMDCSSRPTAPPWASSRPGVLLQMVGDANETRHIVF
mgnify:CR=1 FL=1